MNLFAPGMTILHRSGLGGLACTLRYIQRSYDAGFLSDDDIPGGPWENGAPWAIDDQSITLRFGQPAGAAEFLKRLFRIGFGLKDGLIYLPGQYVQEPNLAVRAELQAGLTLTFLQHGRVRNLEKHPTAFLHDPEGYGQSYVSIEYKRCSWYKHQDGWEELIDGNGCLRRKPVEVIGPLSPGAVVRHVAFTADTKIVDIVERIVPLYFALVGSLALPINRGAGVLIAPDVSDLSSFAVERPLITPTSPKDCRVANESDAALQAMVRLRMRGLLETFGILGCYAMKFESTSWASQQKSRTAALTAEARERVLKHQPEYLTADERRLSQFEVAMTNLSPRLVIRTASRKRTDTRGDDDERPRSFWVDSIVRPLVADNLAAGNAWYVGFSRLMTAVNERGAPLRESLSFEAKGLSKMISDIEWDTSAEELMVEAVHLAIGFNLGRIRKETEGEKSGSLSLATKKRWDRFKERLRLSLAGAKTADQCREAVCSLFGKSGANAALQRRWRVLLPLLTDPKQWQKARDLALLGLASYAGRGDVDDQRDGADDAAD
jgi:CRISPR-associated protein Cas8a1/Csx13